MTRKADELKVRIYWVLLAGRLPLAAQVRNFVAKA